MRIGIFSFRAFDRRLAAPISSGVRQGGGRICPPSGARSAEYPSGARVKESTSLVDCSIFLGRIKGRSKCEISGILNHHGIVTKWYEMDDTLVPNGSGEALCDQSVEISPVIFRHSQ